jgi:gas vesicle protein
MSKCVSSFSGRTVIISMFVGALAGAGVVLLLAPKVRRESVERVRGVAHDLKERASATIGAAKEKVSLAVTRGRDLLGEERAVISSAVEAGKEAYARRRTQGPDSAQV